jgi:hypothetical protein
MAEAAIAAGDADMISLGRALLADPLWPNKARMGRADDIRPCTSCNWCIKETGSNRGVSCAENPRCGHETDPPIDAFGNGRRAVVVGAGPGGIAAALLLDQAGFAVTLFEKRRTAGGNLITSATPPNKEKLFWYHDFLQRRLAASGVDLRLGTEATMETVDAERPDVVVVAGGPSRLRAAARRRRASAVLARAADPDLRRRRDRNRDRRASRRAGPPCPARHPLRRGDARPQRRAALPHPPAPAPARQRRDHRRRP